jgi:hypothetical protein
VPGQPSDKHNGRNDNSALDFAWPQTNAAQLGGDPVELPRLTASILRHPLARLGLDDSNAKIKTVVKNALKVIETVGTL